MESYVESVIADACREATAKLGIARDGSNEPLDDISWGYMRLKNLNEPLDEDDAATRRYVDSVITDACRQATAQLSIARDGSNEPLGDISWGNTRLKNLNDPLDQNDAATRRYVDRSAELIARAMDQKALLRDGSNKPISNINFDGNRAENIGYPRARDEGLFDAVNRDYCDKNRNAGPRHFRLNFGPAGTEDVMHVRKTFLIPNRGMFPDRNSIKVILSPRNAVVPMTSIHVAVTDSHLRLTVDLTTPWRGSLYYDATIFIAEGVEEIAAK